MTTEEDNLPATNQISIGNDLTNGKIILGNDNIIAENLTIQQAPPRPTPSPLFTIPAPPINFTGRKAEIEDLLAHFENGAIISGLSGGGGVGKSALARVLVERLAAQYPDARLQIDLQGAPHPNQKPLTPVDALRRLLQPFHPTAQLPDELPVLQALLTDTLRNKRVLFLLDNARDAAQVRPLLPPAPSAAIVTSRTNIIINDLGLRSVRLGALRPDEARKLLRANAPLLQTAPDAQVDRLARQCGALPLALNVAAALLTSRPDWTPAHLIKLLADERTRLQRLKSPDDPDLDVEASLELSYSLLNEETQRLFRTLGIFPAPFDAPALSALWDIPPEACDEAIGHFLRLSLLEHRLGEAMPYGLHDLTRIYAETLLRRKDEWAVATQRHGDYFLEQGGLADDLYDQGHNDMIDGLRRFDILWPHLRVAYERIVKSAGERLADRWLSTFLGKKVIYALNIRLAPREQILLLENTLASARRLKDRFDEGAHLHGLGSVYWRLGEPQHAILLFEQALSIKREIRDRRGEGKVLNNLGLAYTLAYTDISQRYQAISFYEQALAIAREIGDKRGEANAIGNLGSAYAREGDSHKAITFYLQDLAISREIGDKRGEAVVLRSIGIAYKNLNEPTQAEAFYEQSLVIDRQIGHKRSEANTCWHMGLLLEAQGEYQRAAELMQVRIDYMRAIEHANVDEYTKKLDEVRKKAENR